MSRMFSVLLALLLLPQDAETAAKAIRAEDIRKHQEFLSSDALEGREAGSEGGHRAALYIAGEARKLGLKAGGLEGTWFQPFGQKPAKPLEKGMKNIIALWPGTDAKLREEYVVAGAHYDHVGRGFKNSNVAAGSKPGEIHNGADDNASGASTLLEVAEAVGKARLKRTVAFLWFDAEEGGLAGSRHWAANPTLEISKCVAMVNSDMIGRNEAEKVFVGVEKDAQGAPKYPRWVALIQEVEKQFGAPYDWTEFDAFIKRSDHWPFMEKGVPAMFITGGLHADYHTERDDVEKINFPKEERVGRMVFAIVARAANAAAPLK
jgi:Zn-dependent M28 family amino/carboxypeptidase